MKKSFLIAAFGGLSGGVMPTSSSDALGAIKPELGAMFRLGSFHLSAGCGFGFGLSSDADSDAIPNPFISVGYSF